MEAASLDRVIVAAVKKEPLRLAFSLILTSPDDYFNVSLGLKIDSMASKTCVGRLNWRVICVLLTMPSLIDALPV